MVEAGPEFVSELTRRWQLTLGAPFDREDGSRAWVAPATRSDGTRAVLKLAMPHFEGDHEIDGLRFWSGNPTVQLLESDDGLRAMLLERCDPGTPLRAIPELEQDLEIAQLLRRLWRSPPPDHRFRPLSAMLTLWTKKRWLDVTTGTTRLWSAKVCACSANCRGAARRMFFWRPICMPGTSFGRNGNAGWSSTRSLSLETLLTMRRNTC